MVSSRRPLKCSIDQSLTTRKSTLICTRECKKLIPVKPIYVTVSNLNSVVSCKACAWCVFGMMPSLKKSATLAQTDSWQKDSRLRLHHAGLSHIVNLINKFRSEDKHILRRLCADDKVMICIYTYIL